MQAAALKPTAASEYSLLPTMATLKYGNSQRCGPLCAVAAVLTAPKTKKTALFNNCRHWPTVGGCLP